VVGGRVGGVGVGLFFFCGGFDAGFGWFCLLLW